MVIEDLPGRKTPVAFVSAIQYQQREHMERSLEYAKKTLDLGVRFLDQNTHENLVIRLREKSI